MPAILSCAGLGALALLMLLVVGQPLVTDDAWLHLALGRAYAAGGPWLAADPLLANALGPPTPAAWLFDVALASVERTTGFAGLRMLHVALVAGIVVLAWRLLRRASGSLVVANLATGLFVVLAAYRLIQLRPHLLSMLAALVVYGIALERERVPSRRDVAVVTILLAVWANVHAAFLLGPLLLGTAVLGLVVARPLRDPGLRDSDRRRAIALAGTAAIGALATLLNPAGVRPHLAWFVAGGETPSLGRVADEWSRVNLLALPPPDLPPSLLSWVILWALVIGTVAATVYAVRSRASASGPGARFSVDPVLVALSIASLVLCVIAVRFLWLGIFPLLLLCVVGRQLGALQPGEGSGRRWAAAATLVLLLPAFVRLGPWPMISAALPRTWAGYGQPYHAGKYHAGLVWMIEEAGLQGTAFTDYHMAGFAGYHLAPGVRTLINGTLNVSQDVIAANLPLRLRRGERAGESFTELLDRHGVDIFVGIRLPRLSSPARPWFHTTAHLERTPGWIPVFRNFTGAVYLRTNERNRENLERVAALYAEQGIPFDPAVGFDPARILREDRSWALRHGLVPLHFDQTARGAYGPDSALRARSRDQLAAVYATLGLYERAIDLDEAELASDPGQTRTRRRLAWCLLRLGRISEAVDVARPLEQVPAGDVLSRLIAEATLAVSEAGDAEVERSLVATLPLFTRAEAAVLTANLKGPSPRVRP